MFNGTFRSGVNGPNVFIISFRFLVSSLVIAPINGAVIRYVIRKIVAPMIRVIQFAMFRKIIVMYVRPAEINAAINIFIEDL